MKNLSSLKCLAIFFSAVMTVNLATAGVESCIALENDLDRLACYDTESARIAAAKEAERQYQLLRQAREEVAAWQLYVKHRAAREEAELAAEDAIREAE